MSIIAALKTFIATCPHLEAGALLLVDHAGAEPVQYSIVPLPGEAVTQRYINGGSERAYPFALQTTDSTADDLERIENAAFHETFADWLEAQTASGVMPSLGTGKEAISVTATGHGYLFEQGESDTGIYQIQCRLVYEQSA